MAAQLYVITPATADPQTFPRTLMAVLAVAEVAALLVVRGERDAKSYADWLATTVNIGQGAGCAVLVEADVALAKRVGADGVHVPADLALVRDAVKALKPDRIVGVGPVRSRHDAMSIGELDIDYLLFEDAELAGWWAETFEIPAVFAGEIAADAPADAHGAEFLGLGERLWTAPDPAAALAAITGGAR
jgi:thiamine-phosphate pyrophosphorylase